MNDFFKAFVRTALLVCLAAGLLLLTAGAALVLAPEILGKLLRWGLAILCLLGGISLLMSLLRSFWHHR